MLNMFHMFHSKGNKFYLHDFVKCTFSISLHSNTYELISFRFGIMIDTAKPYIFFNNLNDLEHHRRSQDCKRAWTSAIMLIPTHTWEGPDIDVVDRAMSATEIRPAHIQMWSVSNAEVKRENVLKIIYFTVSLIVPQTSRWAIKEKRWREDKKKKHWWIKHFVLE